MSSLSVLFVPEPSAEWSMFSAFLPAPAPPPLSCCRSGYKGRKPSCLKRRWKHPILISCLGNTFPFASVSVSASIPAHFPPSKLLQGGCLCCSCWRRLLLGRGVSERALVGTDSFPRLPHSHKHMCGCRLMGSDMDNSLRRSHQYTQFQRWRVPDTLTDTDWHKCYAHTHMHT